MEDEPERAGRSGWHRHRVLIGLVVVGALAVGVALLVVAPFWLHGGTSRRQGEVEVRGATVMPFDQAQTTHRFTTTAWGGTETVHVLPGAARDQVGLIRMHLGHEQMLFASGDFSDPMAIHGHSMPGVQALARSAATGALVVDYVTVPGGAELDYRSADPAVVRSVHAWFAAQVRDHGPHATEG
jgi:hypothetical protein